MKTNVVTPFDMYWFSAIVVHSFSFLIAVHPPTTRAPFPWYLQYYFWNNFRVAADTTAAQKNAWFFCGVSTVCRFSLFTLIFQFALAGWVNLKLMGGAG